MPSTVSGWLTRDLLVALRRGGGAAVGQVGGELVRHPGLAALADEGHREVVDGELERAELRRVEEGTGTEVVVLAQGVGEAVLRHHDDAALVAPEPAEREAHQHDQHGEVEHQVAGLAEVAALGAEAVLAARDPEPLLAQQGPRPLEGDVGRLVGLEAAVLREPRQVARGLRRLTAYAAPVDQQPRDDAAHERDHQQDVDRREPDRVVDREQAELLVDRARVWCGRHATGRRAASRPPPEAPRSRGSRPAPAGRAGSAPYASR